ncbi:hypothetical protein AFLA_005230 [Aspergillus flavus NRRL3357]|nr:hypothetical protein AFLA_005230 [Aspergillus flavus NRRL3357]
MGQLNRSIPTGPSLCRTLHAAMATMNNQISDGCATSKWEETFVGTSPYGSRNFRRAYPVNPVVSLDGPPNPPDASHSDESYRKTLPFPCVIAE